jgi:predicted metal-dependent phosphoesterase TrpH
MLKVNLHGCHTNFSDGHITLKDVIKISKKTQRFVQITDHNNLYQFVRLRKEFKKEDAEYILPPSIEITLSEGIDFIACGEGLFDLAKDKRFPIIRKKHIKSLDIPLEEALELAEERSECLLAPHPMYHGITSHSNYANLLPKFNAIEIFNLPLSLLFPWKNKEAYNLAKKYEMPSYCGNDAHFLSSLGACYNIIDADSRTDVYDAVKRGRICPQINLSYLPRASIETESFTFGHLVAILFRKEDVHPPNISSLLTKQLYSV